jgi:uncharacterized alpha/beta hydrolase family protein
MKKRFVTILILLITFARIDAMQNIIVARDNDIFLCDVDSNTEKKLPPLTILIYGTLPTALMRIAGSF